MQNAMVAVLAVWVVSFAAAQGPPPFHLEDATIADIHAAFADGRLTCQRLTRLYLDRIAAYDQRGPALHAVITVNPRAMDTAAAMDRAWATSRATTGPLHCVPIVLKDNFDTADLPTTAGNVSMKESRPAADAFTVARLRAAGALIIAKTNLQEFARGGMSRSSLGGQVRNPYDLARTPGGSSGGTGAAVAANFAVAGTGSDTGQSIRSPASANALVGIRPTRGLVSRGGVMPNSQTQDEVGPIARTVTDAARLLDAMAGYDPADPITAFGRARQPRSYTDGLRADALKGARIGVVENLFGGEARHHDVNRALDQVMATMTRLGATIVRVELPEYDALAPLAATSTLEARTVMERYFASLPATAPLRSFAALVAARTALVQATLEEELAVVDGMNGAAWQERMLTRDRLRLVVAGAMAERDLDALLYPLQRVLVAPIAGDDQPERNGALSNATGFPAVTFPAGFSAPAGTAPLGVPIGGELLGLDYSEPRLLALAFAYEQAARTRRPPRSTPPLPGEP